MSLLLTQGDGGEGVHDQPAEGQSPGVEHLAQLLYAQVAQVAEETNLTPVRVNCWVHSIVVSRCS